jgi:hypothetical protein
MTTRHRRSRAQIDRDCLIAAQCIARGYKLRVVAHALGYVAYSNLFDHMRRRGFATSQHLPPLKFPINGDDGLHLWPERPAADQAIRTYDRGQPMSNE